MFASLAKQFGVTVDAFLKSSLTVLIFFALIGAVLWYFYRKSTWLLIGFAAGALYFFFVTSYNNRQDKTFTITNPDGTTSPGTLDDFVIQDPGATYTNLTGAFLAAAQQP